MSQDEVTSVSGEEAPTQLAVRRTSLRVQLGIAAVAYLAISLVIWAHVWITGDPRVATTCACGDPAEQLWWLEWLPQALLHGHNPFLSNALFARLGGVNAMSNTSWMLPAAVLSPVTLAFGPIASSNLANLVAPVLSGVAAVAFAARFVRGAVARLIAGAIFAFSPFVMGNVNLGHVNLTLLAYMPLALLIGHRLVTAEISPRRAGVQLGVLSVLQFFLGVEVLVLTAIVAASLGVVVAVQAHARVVAALRSVATAAGVAAAICAVALCYPVWWFFFGPRHVDAPFWRLTSPFPFGFLYAQTDAHAPLDALKVVGYEGPRGPGTAFIGWGIMVVLVVGLSLVRDRRRYAAFGIVAVWCLVLEATPNAIWAHLPVLDGVVRVRVAMGVALLSGVMLGLVVDAWTVPEGGFPAAVVRRLGAWGPRAAAGCLVAVAVGPILQVYSVPFTVADASVPAWFTHEHVGSRTAVLVFPFAWGVGDEAMAWQAMTGIRFNLVGGFGFVPGGNKVNDEFVSHLPIAELLVQLSEGKVPLTSAERREVVTTLRRWAPLEVVVITRAAASSVGPALTSLLGPATSDADGALTWTVY